jgi:DNA-binding NarL/FixJ family response regulator
MPIKNGIQATGEIVARYPEMANIGLSVTSASEDQIAMLQAGARTLLNKESAVDQLYAKRNALVRKGAEGDRRPVVTSLA